MKDTVSSDYDLPLTGERFVPVFEGDIVAEHYHRYLFARQFVEGKRVLDIASGEGYGSHLMAELAAQVTGVDIDADTVSHARRNYQRSNLTYYQGDCAAIPLPDHSVDIVVSFETIEHHDKHQEMMREIKRVLVPDGLLVMSSPDKLYYSDMTGLKNPFHVKELYRDEFEALLESYFKNKVLLGQKMLYASGILGDDDSPLLSYSAAALDGAQGMPEPVYLLALASDVDLPHPSSSLFMHDIASSDLARNHEQALGAAQQAGDRQLQVLQQETNALTQQYQDEVAKRAAIHNQTHQMAWLFRQSLRLLKRWPGNRLKAKRDRLRIAYSGYFDPAWYQATYPDILANAVDPLTHYVACGAYEGRSPSARFDAMAWLSQHPYLIEHQQNPLLHYLDHHSHQTGLKVAATGGAATIYDDLIQQAKKPSDTYVGASSFSMCEPSRIRAIAFYLPQFHPFEENDRWWGKGFTEWTNVSKAIPQFEGHYQPHLPGELGFYDLRLPEVQERQVELARQYGLAAFCFHYYWFSGRKRLLERPLDMYLNNKNIDFPFCLCWANENWTRRWDGQESDILMEQRHQPEDDLQFIEDVAPILRDPRYLRVNGRPILIVYRVTLLKDPKKTVKVWRDYCREQGIGEIHLVAAQSFGISDPREYDFDAAVEFPPHGLHIPDIKNQVRLANPQHSGKVFLYESAIRYSLERPQTDYLLYRTVFPSWDNEARKPGAGHIFAGASPELYSQWLNKACEAVDQRPDADEKLVFINAWNEWAEGAHLEPDRRHGYAWLQATQQTLAHYPSGQLATDCTLAQTRLAVAQKRFDTAIVLHLYYPEMWPEISRYLPNLGEYDLYVTIPQDKDEALYKNVLSDVPNAVLLPFPNRGRDIAPFLAVAQRLQALSYQQVCKLHAKKTTHRSDGERWRQECLDALVGEQAQDICKAFQTDPKLGIVGPAGHWLDYDHYWGYPLGRPDHLVSVAKSLGLKGWEQPKDLRFFAGSMFWYRPDALHAMMGVFSSDSFDIELGQKDGTLAHEIERLFAQVAIEAGYRVADTHDLHSPPKRVARYAYAQPSPPFNGYPVTLSASTVPGGLLVPAGWQQQLREHAKQIPGARKLWRFLRG